MTTLRDSSQRTRNSPVLVFWKMYTIMKMKIISKVMLLPSVVVTMDAAV